MKPPPKNAKKSLEKKFLMPSPTLSDPVLTETTPSAKNIRLPDEGVEEWVAVEGGCFCKACDFLVFKRQASEPVRFREITSRIRTASKVKTPIRKGKALNFDVNTR